MEIEKYCGNCGHYLHGQIENPCPINSKYVGYLREGCPMWESEGEHKEEERSTRVCRKCGQVKHIREFSSPNGFVCKVCRPKVKRKRKTY